jgi:hypothetical protein
MIVNDLVTVGLLLHCTGFEQILERAHLDGLLYLPPKDIVHFEKNAASALQWCVAHKDRPAATATALPIKVSTSHENIATHFHSTIHLCSA